MSDWESVQYTIYDFGLSRCCGSIYNLGDADIKGLEVDVTALLSDQWTFSASVALNNGKTVGDFELFNGRLAVPDGTKLPNVPELKGNFWTRYGFDMGDFDGYVQAAWSYTGGSFNEIRPDVRTKQDSYNYLNLRAGIAKDSWGADLFINNVTDEVAQIYISPRPYEPSTTTNRPRSYGLKFWARF